MGKAEKWSDLMSDHGNDKGDQNGKLLYCSFCGKSQHEVRKLIAGPSVFICDECVDLLMTSFAKKFRKATQNPVAISCLPRKKLPKRSINTLLVNSGLKKCCRWLFITTTSVCVLAATAKRVRMKSS